MDIIAWLDANGNKAYELEKKNNGKLLALKITEGTDAGYTSKFFDVLQWWKLVGDKKYGELGIAATIFLGKPTHNGFQERVFSRGTYSDTRLKKRLKEQNFEMSVLNAFNGKRIDSLKEKLKVQGNWSSDKFDRYVPNKVQARDVLNFFKVNDNVPIIDNTPLSTTDENTDAAVEASNDDDTISEGSEVPFLDGDDDDSSLEDFLNSDAFLEHNLPEDLDG